jgi:hypothetical protein
MGILLILSFDLVPIESNLNHFLLVLVIEILDLNKIKSKGLRTELDPNPNPSSDTNVTKLKHRVLRD